MSESVDEGTQRHTTAEPAAEVNSAEAVSVHDHDGVAGVRGGWLSRLPPRPDGDEHPLTTPCGQASS